MEPEGWQLIQFVGTITTLDVDDDSFGLWETVRGPFGFQAPAQRFTMDVPELTSSAWDDWLCAHPDVGGCAT